ncbi:MAG: hypothetical protein ACFCUM_15415 [Bacteroidales bacterium]
MKNKIVLPVLISLAVIVMVIVVVSENNSTRPGKGPANPYAYDASEFARVDPSQVTWTETRQILLDNDSPRAIASRNNNIYILTSENLQILNSEGSRIKSISLQADPVCFDFSESGNIIVGFTKFMILLDADGNVTRQSEPVDGNARFTSIAQMDGNIFVADGINRRVIVFDENLEITSEFKGESGVSEIHGFIVPDTRFTLGVNQEDELWITNPGLHSIQNYTASGNLRSYIQSSSFGIEGFSGCCNPVHFTFLPDGGFVTSEKGLIRVKVLKESGEVESVVAPPEKFAGGTMAPAVAVDSNGHVLLLDFDRNMVRIFEPAKI